MLRVIMHVAFALSFVTTAFAGYDEDFKAAKDLGVAGKHAEALAAWAWPLLLPRSAPR